MLVLHPRTLTVILVETGGRVAVGSKVSEIDVNVSVGMKMISVAVADSVSMMFSGVFVTVMITGVGVKMDGVMVEGGAGKVGI